MKIYLDFDGTMVEHAYPKLGRPVPEAIRVVKRLMQEGHTIILNTYRSEIKDSSLADALQYLNRAGISLNSYLPNKFHPWEWDLSLICNHNHLYIDDMAFGIPLIPAVMQNNNMVDWLAVERQLEAVEILKKIKIDAGSKD